MIKALCVTMLFMIAVSCGGGPDRSNSSQPSKTPSPSTPANTEVKPPQPAQTKQPETVGRRLEREETVRFGPDGLPAGWKLVDPDAPAPSKMSFVGEKLVLTIPSGKDLFGENRTAPRVLTAIAGDFQIETRVEIDPKEDYQGAGLIIFQDDENYVRLERAFGGTGGGESGIRMDVRTPTEYKPLSTPGDVPTSAGEVDLKIIRKGNVITAFWRLNEEAEWKEAGAYEAALSDSLLVGLIGCNTASEIKAGFSYIKFGPLR